MEAASHFWKSRKAVGLWLLAVALPALTTYRLARTVLACWRQERWLLVRRPVVVLLCWLGMWGWGLGFLAGARRGAVER